MANNLSGDNITLPAEWRAKSVPLAAAGAILIVVSVFVFISATDGYKAFMHSYLANYMFCLTICLGALFFVMVQHLVRSGWSAAVRRIAELYAATIPFWAILFLPILITLFGNSHALYEWNLPADSPDLHPVVREKLPYLNSSFFSIRTVIYFAVFIAAARIYFGMSRKQDETGDTEITLKLQRWAGPMIMLFSLALNFAAFDWMMSTEPAWFSTIYGVYVFAASMLSFFATLIFTCYLLQRSGRMDKIVSVEHYHDMSKFQFGFIVFWAYIAFSQFMLYWYGNIPEETFWYLKRIQGGWQYLGIMLIGLHFVVPFLGTVSRHVRRRPALMAFWAVFILFVHWLDMTFLIMPNVESSPSVSLILAHLLCWVGMVLVFLSLFLWRVGETPIVAIKDPWLPDSLAYQNLP
jgi:hypothetical protein